MTNPQPAAPQPAPATQPTAPQPAAPQPAAAVPQPATPSQPNHIRTYTGIAWAVAAVILGSIVAVLFLFAQKDHLVQTTVAKVAEAIEHAKTAAEASRDSTGSSVAAAEAARDAAGSAKTAAEVSRDIVRAMTSRPVMVGTPTARTTPASGTAPGTLPTPPAPVVATAAEPTTMPGKYKKEFQLTAGTWSDLVRDIPPGRWYRIGWEPIDQELEIKFLDDTVAKITGGDYTDVAIRRGVFQCRAAVDMAITITATY
jgi:hypothetical protein